jgi:hypothetical protein
LAGGNAVFYYTSLGSNFGVNPPLYNGTGVKTPKLDLNTCVGTTTTCNGWTTNANSTIPELGYSDINPTAFTGPNTPIDTALSTEFNTLFPSFQTAYPELFNAMKEDSAANGDTQIYPVNGMTFAIVISNTLATALGGTATGSYLDFDALGRLKVSLHQNIYEADFEYGKQGLRCAY